MFLNQPVIKRSRGPVEMCDHAIGRVPPDALSQIVAVVTVQRAAFTLACRAYSHDDAVGPGPKALIDL